MIIIIGVLASIAIPAFLNQRMKANDAVLKSELKNVATAIHTWEASGKNISSDTRYIDATYHYVAYVNTSPLNAWPRNISGVRAFVPEFLEGYNPTEGTRISVKIVDPSVGFCVAGAKDNSNYDSLLDNNVAYTSRMLFYDSVTGKVSDRQSLTRHGGCEYFAPKG